MKILVPNTIDLDLEVLVGDLKTDDRAADLSTIDGELGEFGELGATIAGDSVVTYDASAPFGDGTLDADLLVVWHNTPENLADAANRLTELRLVQTLAAGPDAVVNAGFTDTVSIASGRSLHDGPVSEHALMLILAAVRRLDELLASQAEHEWNTAVDDAQTDPRTAGRFTLHDARVTIWGFGSIAARLAPVLRMLGATVTGVAHTAGTRGGFDVVAANDAAATLSDTDVLVSLLPASPQTADTFGAALFAQLKPGTIFVNVGRGATVDEDALLAALEAGTLRAAALDVTKAEPLPPESPLWQAPGLILTPHIAGNRPQGASELVRRNIAALRNGDAIVNLVSRA